MSGRPVSCHTRVSSSEAGLALMEVVISVGLLVTLAAGLVQLFAMSAQSMVRARHRTSALILAVEKLEQIRAAVLTQVGRPPSRLSIAAEDRLMSYSWPGNVHELQNCIERAVILCEEAEIRPTDLDLDVGAVSTPEADPWDAIDLSGTLADASHRALAEVERRKISSALKAAGNNTGRVADALRISHRALVVKMQDHGIIP